MSSLPHCRHDIARPRRSSSRNGSSQLATSSVKVMHEVLFAMASTRSFARARSMIVSAKLGLSGPKTQAMRTARCRGDGASAAPSPASLVRAIVAKRTRGIFLDVRRGLCAIKNIVRAEMDKARLPSLQLPPPSRPERRRLRSPLLLARSRSGPHSSDPCN